MAADHAPSIQSRTVLHDGWRLTWYQRADGSEFSVLVPPLLIRDEHDFEHRHDENAEERMVGRLA